MHRVYTPGIFGPGNFNGLFSKAAASPALLSAKRGELPNFTLIVTDDHGYHDLGCQGAEDLKTPHIDSFAASGVRFLNWYSNAPVCAPSRASIRTGRYPVRAGVPRNGLSLAASQLTIARLLHNHGYRTACFGKWHLGSTPETVPNSHGYDYFYGFHSGCVDFYSHRYYWGEPHLVNYHDLWRNRTEIFEDGQYLTERITEETIQFIERNKKPTVFCLRSL